MPQHTYAQLKYPAEWTTTALARPAPRPPRRNPHKERGVSSIVEWLWNVYAQKASVQLHFWFTKRLEVWISCHWRAIRRIRSMLDENHKKFMFLSWDDPEMKDPIVWSFGWYELYIALMALTLENYEKMRGMDYDDEDALEMDGTINDLNREVNYATHHVKMAIEVLESLEEDTLRKHPIGKAYISALNEASVYVFSIYGYGDWVTPIRDSRIEKDPIGTFLSWFQQSLETIRARNSLNFNIEAAQKEYAARFQNRFGVGYAHLPESIIQKGVPSPPVEMEAISTEYYVPEEEVVFSDEYLDVDESLEVYPASAPICDYNNIVPYYQNPPVEMYSNPQDFSSGFLEQPQPIANSWDSMAQYHYQYAEQPNQFDLSNQWSQNNQYDPYMGFTFDQEYSNGTPNGLA